MDARIDPLAALGLELGDAHVLRNAGAFATDDMLRSLVVSQRLIGTRSVAVIGHTECGAFGLNEPEFVQSLTWETGSKLDLHFGSFDDLDAHVLAQMARVRACTWIPHTDDVRGFVYDVADGSVRPVDDPA
jgi:carbonic anhydrase